MHEHPPVYFAPYAPDPPDLTFDYLDPAWDIAEWTLPFSDILGAKNPSPPYSTRVKMLWSESGLFLLADLEEPHLWATLTDFNSIIFHDNDFEWFIDPDGDNCNYLEWEVNAFGTEMNLYMRKPYLAGGDYEFVKFDGLKHRVRLDGTVNDSSNIDKGWTVECFVPWSVFEMYCGISRLPEEGEVWRIAFSRVQWDLEKKGDTTYEKVKNRSEHNWTWTNQHEINMHRPWFWGYVYFGKYQGWFEPDHEARMNLAEVFEMKKGGVQCRFDVGSAVVLEEFESGWVASTVGGSGRRVFMDHTARMWTEEISTGKFFRGTRDKTTS